MQEVLANIAPAIPVLERFLSSGAEDVKFDLAEALRDAEGIFPNEIAFDVIRDILAALGGDKDAINRLDGVLPTGESRQLTDLKYEVCSIACELEKDRDILARAIAAKKWFLG